MNIRLLYLLPLALASTACDGDATSDVIAPTSNLTIVDINASNAKPAVRIAYGATLESIDNGDLVGGSPVSMQHSGQFEKITVDAIAGTMQRAVEKIPLGPTTSDCAVSGTTTISGDLANPLTLTVGDSINIESQDCDDGQGTVVSGRIEMSVAVFSGDLTLGRYLLEMDILLIDLSVSSAAGVVTSNGDTTVSLDTTGSPLISIAVSGNSLTSIATTQGTTETLTMISFSSTQTTDTSIFPAAYTLAAAGTIDSTVLDGRISYSTPVTFQGAGFAHPFAGQLLVTGQNSAVRMTVLDESSVLIETDADGDGEFESSEETSWDDIAF